MPFHAVREFGKIVASGEPQGLDVLVVPRSAFTYLQGRSYGLDEDDPVYQRFLTPARHLGQEALQVRNFVGVLRTPCGTQIEIFPKVPLEGDADTQLTTSRRLLLRMLGAVKKLPAKQADLARLAATDGPLLEAYLGEFLREVARLVQHGVRSDYVTEEGNLIRPRGKLRLAQQLRLNVARPERFYMAYDELSLDRAENRLLRSALEVTMASCSTTAHKRRSRELLLAFEEVSPSQDIGLDFGRCISDRNISHYAGALSWARLILQHRTPTMTAGRFEAMAILHPMDQLFQEYVAVSLSRQFPAWRIRTQVASVYLAHQDDRRYFRLIPDLVLEAGGSVMIADAKWKVLHAGMATGAQKYGISQADVYQLFAYAHKYIPAGRGERRLFVIAPRHAGFEVPLRPFALASDISLHVVPFDLEEGEVVGADAFAVPSGSRPA